MKLIISIFFLLGAVNLQAQINYGGKRVDFQGDSRTAGIGATNYTLRWAYLHSAESNGVEWNNGISGMYLQNVSGGSNQFSETVIDAKGTQWVKLWIAFGSNDIRGDTNIYRVDSFKAKLIRVVDYAVSVKGYSYADIILQSVNYIVPSTGYTSFASVARHESYNEAIRQVALLRGTVYLDIYTYFKSMSARDTYFVDGLHENNAGNRVIADFMNMQTYSVYTGIISSTIILKGRKRLIP